MNKELRKIYKITGAEHITDVEIPRKTSEKAKVSVKICSNFDFEGSAQRIIDELQYYMKDYFDVRLEAEIVRDYYDEFKSLDVYGTRLETDDEYGKRQKYHLIQKEKTKIEKEKKKELERLKLAEKENEEKEEYDILKRKYGE